MKEQRIYLRLLEIQDTQEVGFRIALNSMDYADKGYSRDAI